MNLFIIGDDIAVMIVGVPVVAAGILWLTRWRGARKRRRAALEQRNWHGYINPHGVSDWRVRLAEDPQTLTARVVLEVIDRSGGLDPGWAHDLRETIKRDGMIARVPTPEEYDFIRYLFKERGYGKGLPVGSDDGVTA
jgi:hypothetical protein